MGHLQYTREQYHEMDLREYIEVIIKRKKILMAVVVGSMVIGIVWSFVTPTEYEVSMVVEPPGSVDGGIQTYDSVGNIKAKIESGALNAKILNELNLRRMPELIVTQPKDTRLIRVSMVRPQKQADQGVDILARLLAGLNLSYSELLENKRNRIDNQIGVVAGHIRTRELESKLKSEQLKILTDREKQLVEEIKETKVNSEKLLAKREALFGGGDNKDGISSLLYTATIQQNVAYFSQLQNELSSLKTNKENLLSGMENIKNIIGETRVEIANLNMSRKGVTGIQVIQEPLVSLQPVGPGKKKITLISVIVGLVLGFFCALFAEYWERPQLLSVRERQTA